MGDIMNDTMSDYLEYKTWYNKSYIILEIVKQLKNRETCFIDSRDKRIALRCLKIHNLNHWNTIKKWSNFDQHLYNIYYSLARYKDGIPNQTLNISKRDNTEWNKEHWKHIETFDFLIDFDADNEEHAQELKRDVMAVSNILQVPHSIRYSGMGYHIIIRGEYMPKLSYNPDDKNCYFDLVAELLKSLKKNYCGFIDLSTCDSRRVVKIPYSLANYENEQYVCYPYRKHSEIITIHPKQHTPSWILNSTDQIMYRGVPEINMDTQARIKATMKAILGKKWGKYEK